MRLMDSLGSVHDELHHLSIATPLERVEIEGSATHESRLDHPAIRQEPSIDTRMIRSGKLRMGSSLSASGCRCGVATLDNRCAATGGVERKPLNNDGVWVLDGCTEK